MVDIYMARTNIMVVNYAMMNDVMDIKTQVSTDYVCWHEDDVYGTCSSETQHTLATP